MPNDLIKGILARIKQKTKQEKSKKNKQIVAEKIMIHAVLILGSISK